MPYPLGRIRRDVVAGHALGDDGMDAGGVDLDRGGSGEVHGRSRGEAAEAQGLQAGNHVVVRGDVGDKHIASFEKPEIIFGFSNLRQVYYPVKRYYRAIALFNFAILGCYEKRPESLFSV